MVQTPQVSLQAAPAVVAEQRARCLHADVIAAFAKTVSLAASVRRAWPLASFLASI
jgi:hypothetical protein